ncbi:trans-2,3-dihydro-3-hydroxyanthranilate isomerase [Methylohalomonas lacus]|uniref:Trans-2,3-dihydro-3-hydroxyanthranilate isomerase n=1 Tax=Methylohalomonas lacus TaxID=398773 RepID=A0AAE3L1C4_9GAMM|nr:PhzF family phenazine biosynthesis protein [Methylohalomonas lacus]MCS3903370.1 trans-2,3-dihydro-3-hydroxyanthranilate isomerase [Methylohalomonas lacus]
MAETMTELNYYTLDVFTERVFGGNPLAVIPDAPDLDTGLMQSIAREFNYPETVFVRPAEHPDALRRLRIFTPQSELPFAGHPTIGTAQLLAEIGMAPAPASDVTEFLLEEGIGQVPITLQHDHNGGCFTWLTLPQLPEAGLQAPPAARLANMLGLAPEQIGAHGMPVQTGSAGVPMTLIPLRDRQALRDCVLDLHCWRDLLANSDAAQVYLFCRGDDASGVDFHARMFAPALGVPEDPATGAAAAAFAGYLWHATRSAGHYVIAQGEDMLRPSRLHIELSAAGDHLQRVRVGGRAVRVCHGQMRV